MYQGLGDADLQSACGGFDFHRLHMSKIDKKRAKIKERILFLEEELRLSLTKKTSDTREISVGGHQRKISDLYKELQALA
jgi:hypothetical protein